MEWRGLFAGVPTPFGEDETLELAGIEMQLERLVEAGVAGVAVLGPLGEDASLSGDEKRAVVLRAVQAAGGRVPVLAAVCETTTHAACHVAVDCERLGADGLVVVPSPLDGSNLRETLMHVRSVAASSELPVMVQAGDGLEEMLPALAEIENIEAVAESTADPRRVARLADAAGTRFAVVAGVDELVLYSVLHGARGQLGTSAGVFPREAVERFELAVAGRWEDALALHRRLAPLERLVADGAPVQTVKLAHHILGLGSETVRAPRLPLAGMARDTVERAVRDAIERRPALVSNHDLQREVS